jgi:hypothetical protein
VKKELQAKIRFFVKDLKQPPAVKRAVEQVTVEQEKAGICFNRFLGFARNDKRREEDIFDLLFIIYEF